MERAWGILGDLWGILRFKASVMFGCDIVLGRGGTRDGRACGIGIRRPHQRHY